MDNQPPVEPLSEQDLNDHQDTNLQALDHLTLSEVLGQFWRAPRKTLQLLYDVTSTPMNIHHTTAVDPAVFVHHDESDKGAFFPTESLIRWGTFLLFTGMLSFSFLALSQRLVQNDWGMVAIYAVVVACLGVTAIIGLKTVLGAYGTPLERFKHELSDREKHQIKLVMVLVGFLIGVIGGYLMIDGQFRSEERQLMRGAPYIMAGALLWLVAEWFIPSPKWGHSKREWGELPVWRWGLTVLTEVPLIRLGAGAILPILLSMVWTQSYANQFRGLGVLAWVISIISVVVVFAPDAWMPQRVFAQLKANYSAQKWRFRLNWVWVLFVVILLVGIAFRIHDFANVPPQMTSDHKEKLLDAQRILNGARDIFFMNNGGREVFQMYALALLSELPGLGINYPTLMLLAVIESVLTLPLMFWFGREIAGKDQRSLGNALGLIMMALLAVSYWHLTITRMALRIVLTPMIGIILMGLLIRIIRENKRGDYIKAGLVLGFGLYTYQAVRMMPVLVLVAVGIGILWNIRNRQIIMRYGVHLGVLVAVSLVVFMPLMRFSVDYPQSFWMRSTGRLFGDSLIEEINDEGARTLRNATLEDRLIAFSDNLPMLGENMRNALLMFNWRGDGSWFNGVPFQPQLDPLAGTLFILGILSCGVLVIRTRDPVYVLLPLGVLIMLLPSALSIAMAHENPSATRASGAIPATFAIASLPILMLLILLKQLVLSRHATILVVIGTGLLAYLSMGFNGNLYYNEYRRIYSLSTWDYRTPAEILRGFDMSDGDYNNAYMIGYTLWWDYRIIGIEAGKIDWANGIVDVTRLPAYMSDQYYCANPAHPLDLERDFMVFYHVEDGLTAEKLAEWFPNGYSKQIITFNSPRFDFMIYRIPAMDETAFSQFVTTYAEDPACEPIIAINSAE
jgi:hypothetical protein